MRYIYIYIYIAVYIYIYISQYIYIYIYIYYIYVSQYIAEWCLSIAVYRSVTVSIAEGVTESDLYVKPTDSHQYLLSSSSYPFYCKKDIQYTARH